MLTRLFLRLKQIIGVEPKFLCDRCFYDHDSACSRRERPNATYCEDYKRR